MVLELVWDVFDLAGDGAEVLKILQGSLFFKSLPGVLKDMDIHDEAGDGVRVPKISQGSFTESFINSQHQKACQDSIYPPSLFLETWRTVMFLMKLDIMLGYPIYPKEALVKVSSRSNIKKLSYPPSLFLESWRTGMLLMKLEMVSGYPKYPKEALLKVSSRSNIRKLVKTTPIIKVSSWSLGGHGGS